MPITPTYPGVYIQELASDVRTVVPVDTATTAFIGRALRGPTDRPVTIFGFDEFERVFGGLWIDSKLGFAVRDFFLNGGSKAIVVRAFRGTNNDPTSEPALLALNPQPEQPASPPPGAPDPADLTARLAAATQLADATAAEADAKLAEYKAKDQLAKALEALAQPKLQKIQGLTGRQATAAARLKKAQDDLEGVKEDAPGYPALKQAADQAQEEKTAADAAVTAAADLAAAADAAVAAAKEARDEADQAKGESDEAELARDTAKETLQKARNQAAQAMPGVQLAAANVGRWGEQLVLRVTKEDNPEVRRQLASQYGVKEDDLFNLTIRDLKTDAEEYYPNVTLSDGPRRLDRVLSAQSQLVRVPAGKLDTYLGGPPLAHPPAPKGEDWWKDRKYSSTFVDTVSDGLFGTSSSDDAKAIEAAIDLLDQADLFNMLCIPPYNSGDVDHDVLAKASSYCEKRRAMLIVDPPTNWTDWRTAQAESAAKVLSPSANAAIFFPRIRKRNPLHDNQLEDFAPCGAVAGVMARTDFRRGVWKAAAGLEATLNGVEGFSVQIDDNANGQLNPLGINCLRVMPGAGPVIWGARTTVGDDRLANQWKYIPVRRMALWIEETLYRSTQWAVFEPNDEPLWSSLRLNIGNFMNGLFRQGAFQGKSPAEAYFVRCDATTTTQTDIDRGIVNVVVGFAPLKPAEFVIISIKQISNQGAA